MLPSHNGFKQGEEGMNEGRNEGMLCVHVCVCVRACGSKQK